MRDKNPQSAKVGDLIMWANYDGGGINFGKIVSFASDWRPMAKGFRQPWFEEERIVGFKYIPDEKGWTFSMIDGVQVRVRSEAIRESVNVSHPLQYANTQRVTDGWMVIAYGDGRAEATTEEHPIAKARRQFMELEGKKGYAF